MAAPMFGPGGTPIFGAGGLPLICEPGSVCCGPPPVPASCFQTWPCGANRPGNVVLLTIGTGSVSHPSDDPSQNGHGWDIPLFGASIELTYNPALSAPNVPNQCAWDAIIPLLATFAAQTIPQPSGCPSIQVAPAPMPMIFHATMGLQSGGATMGFSAYVYTAAWWECQQQFATNTPQFNACLPRVSLPCPNSLNRTLIDGTTPLQAMSGNAAFGSGNAVLPTDLHCASRSATVYFRLGGPITRHYCGTREFCAPVVRSSEWPLQMGALGNPNAPLACLLQW